MAATVLLSNSDLGIDRNSRAWIFCGRPNQKSQNFTKPKFWRNENFQQLENFKKNWIMFKNCALRRKSVRKATAHDFFAHCTKSYYKISAQPTAQNFSAQRAPPNIVTTHLRYSMLLVFGCVIIEKKVYTAPLYCFHPFAPTSSGTISLRVLVSHLRDNVRASDFNQKGCWIKSYIGHRIGMYII